MSGLSPREDDRLKISDYIRDRDKRNFGTCKRCDKRVYWSTCKVVSHIRSGHCPEATDDEVKKFKHDYIYTTPKNLVHRSSSEIRSTVDGGSKRKLSSSSSSQNFRKSKVPKSEDISDESGSEKEEMYEVAETIDGESIQYVVLQDSSTLSDVDDVRVKRKSETKRIRIETSTTSEPPLIILETVARSISSSSSSNTKEDKFINAVYPQYATKTKLQLIEEILEMKRQNDQLQSKCTTYEETIHRLLN